MQEICYLEIPTPDTAAVQAWLRDSFEPQQGHKKGTPSGCTIGFEAPKGELSIVVWSLQRTTYLKVFRWSDVPLPGEQNCLQALTQALSIAFPPQYPQPPVIDLEQQSIFAGLAADYPNTVKYFQRMPNGEYDLTRAYWWEQRWRQGVQQPQQPPQVVYPNSTAEFTEDPPAFDLIYLGGALGVIHAAVMARLGYRVLLVERLPFGRMNREWNISRSEIQSLVDLGLLTAAEVEQVVMREYPDGYHKFFDANNPPGAKAPVLHTPTVLNIALDSERLLALCGDKLRQAGGEIWDQTEFTRADIAEHAISIQVTHLPTGIQKPVTRSVAGGCDGNGFPYCLAAQWSSVL